jgi:DNA gyrase subunit A
MALARKGEIAFEVAGARTEPREWLECHLRAAQRGSLESLFQLGVAFLAGDRVPRDCVEGYKWLFLAATQGHRKASEYFDEDFDYSDESFDRAQRRSAEFEETYNILVPALDEREIPSLAVTFAVTHSGMIGRVEGNFHQAQRGITSWVAGIGNRNGVASGDFAEHIFIGKPHDHLMFFTATGRVYARFVNDVADGRATRGSCAVTSFLGLESDETIVGMVCVPARTGPSSEDITWRQSGFLFFTTRQGTVKRTSLGDFAGTNKVWARANGVLAIGIEAGDALASVQFTSGQDQIVIITKNGMSIRFSEQDVPPMGLPAGGVRGITLEQGDTVVAAPKAVHGTMLLLVDRHGIGSRRPFDEYLLQSRAGKGIVAMKNGGVIAALGVSPDGDIMCLSAGGQRLRMQVRTIPPGRDMKLVSLVGNDRLLTVVPVVDSLLNLKKA